MHNNNGNFFLRTTETKSYSFVQFYQSSVSHLLIPWL